MSPLREIRFRRAACLGGCLLASIGTLLAAETNTPRRTLPTADVPPPPVLPQLRSPVDSFRELLAMTPAERRRSLTNRPPEVQKRILAKVREYESLKPAERELRLRATELQWHLKPLMSLAPSNRADRLTLVPEPERKLVEERLARWDRLPPSLQEQMLNDEMTARYFTQLETADQTNRVLILQRMSPERRAKLEAGFDRWRGLSEEQRQKVLHRFDEFFELTPAEKEKVLNTLSETEQAQMEKTLQTYAKLTSVQRAQCIQSFEKFASMNLAERQLFLKNAERWKLMSPAEREAWRKLVSFAPLQPPMPVLTPRLPPSPMLQRRSGPAVATNSN